MRQSQTPKKLGKQPKEVSENPSFPNNVRAALIIFSFVFSDTSFGCLPSFFGKEGFSDAKLRDIAQLAGTTHNLIRHHFGSKVDLWKAVVDYGLRLNEARLRQILDAQGTANPVELYKTFIRSHIEFMAKHIALSKILLHNTSRNSPHLDYIIERQKGVHDIIEPIFHKVKARGYFNGFDHKSFSIYMRAISETPLATSDLTNKMMKGDILSKKGIAQHTERVINILFQKGE